MHSTMHYLSPLFLLLMAAPPQHSAPSPLRYAVQVDARANRVQVELRMAGNQDRIVLAAHAHPEYDDKYWRYVDSVTARAHDGRVLRVTRVDSVRWEVQGGAQTDSVVVRWRMNFPQLELPRSSWRASVDSNGGLIGGPHTFLYPVGREAHAAEVRVELPAHWRVGTALERLGDGVYRAPNVFMLMESPLLIGPIRTFSFHVRNTPHFIHYLGNPRGVAFDTTAFVGGIAKLVTQAEALFGGFPYAEYHFLLQHDAYIGGLEHPNSVTMGAPSAELARDPYYTMPEIAHEFIHTWNLMAIKPVEYREVDYRVQRPVSGLWFSEGLTMYYADALLRRAGLPTPDSTRVAHVQSLITRYLSSPGNSRFAAEATSRAEYNASPTVLGDYMASSHLQGELIGLVIDARVRRATNGAKTMDDVMRAMYARHRSRGFDGRDVERTVTEVCGCSVADVFERYVRRGSPMDFARHLAEIGLAVSIDSVEAREADGSPSRDLRLWGWVDDAGVFRLRIDNPESVWGRAGLHTGDRLVSINSMEVASWPALREFLTRTRMGDTSVFVVERGGRRDTLTAVMRPFVRPEVSVVADSAAGAEKVRLREAWVRGR